jgi:hypothetical protein
MRYELKAKIHTPLAQDGGWEIWLGAKFIRRSKELFKSKEAALTAGEEALALLKLPEPREQDYE